jgi:hypothetical protein
MGLPAGGVLMRDRTKVAPSLRASSSATGAAAQNDVAVTIDGSAQAGDFVVIIVGTASDTCSTPAGLTKECRSLIGNVASVPYLHVYTRWLRVGDVASDVGLTYTFTSGDNSGICATVQVFKDTSGFAVRPTFEINSSTDALNSQPCHAPTVTMGPAAFYAGAAVALSYVSSGLAAVTLTSAPSGCTINQAVQVARQAGTAGTCRGMGCWTGPTHAPTVETFAFTANVYYAACSFALAPVKPHRVQTTRGPSSLDGLPVYCYSNSSGSIVPYAQATPTRGANSYNPWPERIQSAFGQVVPARNMAMGGARAADICSAAYGTQVVTSTRSGANNSAVITNQNTEQAITQSALANRLTALYVTDLVGNDFLKLGTDDVTMAGAWNAIEALFRLIRSANQYLPGQGGSSADASFTTVTSPHYLGGTAVQTTTPGGKVTINVTDKDAIDLVLIATDDAALGVVGAPFTVKVDGVVRSTATSFQLHNPGRTVNIKHTTSNQHQNSGAYFNPKFCQMTVSLTGIGAGAHTITVEHAGNNGDQLTYNGYLVPAATPPWIVTNTIWDFPDATYTAAPLSFASAAVGKQTAEWFNEIVRQVAALFADGRVIVFDPVATGRFDPSKHVSTGDGVHHSEEGIAFYEFEVIKLLNARLPAPDVTVTLPTPIMPVSPPFTHTLGGTRDWQVPATAAYTFECEGPGGGGAGGGPITGQGRSGGHGAYAKKNATTLTKDAILTFVNGTAGPGGAPGAAGGPGGMKTKVVYKSGPDFAPGTVLCEADFGLGGGVVSGGSPGAGGQAANSTGDVTISGLAGTTYTPGGGPGAGDTLGAAGGSYSGAGVGANGGTPGGGGSGANPGNSGGSGGGGAIRVT